jgi:hypothetical protein
MGHYDYLAMPVRHRHRVGRYLIVDDESGIVAYDDQIVKRWDGALVRQKAYETRHPQEFVRARNDPRALKDVRPAVESTAAALGPTFFVGNTNVPSNQGIGYRLTQAGIGQMRVGASFVIQGEVDDISVTAAPLKFDPDWVVPLTTPVTVNATANGANTITLNSSANRHVIVTLASGGEQSLSGFLNIRGTANSDCRVWIIGGGNAHTDTGSGNHKVVDISNVEKAYAEGLYLSKRGSLGDCLTFRGSAAIGGTLYLQNCRLEGGQTSAAGIHGDALQIQSQIKGLHIYRSTMRAYSQGYLINSSFADQYVSGSAIVSGSTWEDVNIRVRSESENTETAVSARHGLYLQDSVSAKPVPYTLTNVFVYDEGAAARGYVGTLCRPGPQGSNLTAASAGYGSIEAWDTITWPSATRITGEVREGLPPGGDYVKDTFTGTNYRSPGYR